MLLPLFLGAVTTAAVSRDDNAEWWRATVRTFHHSVVFDSNSSFCLSNGKTLGHYDGVLRAIHVCLRGKREWETVVAHESVHMLQHIVARQRRERGRGTLLNVSVMETLRSKADDFDHVADISHPTFWVELEAHFMDNHIDLVKQLLAAAATTADVVVDTVEQCLSKTFVPLVFSPHRRIATVDPLPVSWVELWWQRFVITLCIAAVIKWASEKTVSNKGATTCCPAAARAARIAKMSTA